MSEPNQSTTQTVATPSVPATETKQRSTQLRRHIPKQKTPDWVYMTPLLAAPVLPMIRIGMRNYPKQTRDRVFGAAVAGFFIHGTILLGYTYTNKD